MTTRAQSPATPELSIARQPVFDEKRRLWGYLLHGFGAHGKLDAPENGENAVVNVANSTYMGLQHILDRGKKIIIDFSEKGIVDGMPYALPPQSAVMMVGESVLGKPDVIRSLEQMKRDGFLLAVAGFSGAPAGDALYRLADILCVAAGGRRADELERIMRVIGRYPATGLALHVNTPAAFDRCRETGFTLFAGGFFKAPEVLRLREMTSNAVSRFKLLRLLETAQPDMDALTENIQADASVSFRLLAYLNSAAFGFPQQIKSIQQAVSLLGWNRIRNWLRVVLITDTSQHKHISDLMLLSAQRGKFLELLAKDHDYWGFDPNSMHLLGIFSLLDVMLGIPMAEIVSHLPLEARLKSALCGEAGSEYLELLKLARLLEEARWAEAEGMVQQLNLDGNKIRRAFQRAIDWAAELTTLQYAAPK